MNNPSLSLANEGYIIGQIKRESLVFSQSEAKTTFSLWLLRDKIKREHQLKPSFLSLTFYSNVLI